MSTEPDDFAALVDVLQRLRQGLGDGVKAATASELGVRAVARRSIVAARDLRAGSILSREDLAVKRPGDGLSPERLPSLIGRKLVRAVAAEGRIRAEDVTD
jgi:sialic acid synthase SpsE